MSSINVYAISGKAKRLFSRLGKYKIVCRQIRLLSTMEDSSSLAQLLGMARSIVPALTLDKYKGQAGRIAVIGGSKEYTGAPYFAAITALKVGADLSHVFCTDGASVVIKSYSPELIVHPVLDNVRAVEEVSEWLPRMHSIVIGPGLGRDPSLFPTLQGIFQKARDLDKPLVVDADGIFYLTHNPSAIEGNTRAILTPNAVEFARLYEKVMNEKEMNKPEEDVSSLSSKLGNVAIVRKGPQDVISDGHNVLVCDTTGSARRCGGQGDLLSGSLGVFAYWAYLAMQNNTQNELLKTYGPRLCASWAACHLTRDCNHRAYKQYGRSMVTTNMIDCIGQSFLENFGENDSKL